MRVAAPRAEETALACPCGRTRAARAPHAPAPALWPGVTGGGLARAVRVGGEGARATDTREERRTWI